MKEPGITVCIPTYKRIDLLTEAINSCLAQTHLPQEIIIGDNSPNTDTQRAVEAIAQAAAVPIRYYHHVPGLTQPQNVDILFSHVQSEFLLLLHDDDTIERDCLAAMLACFKEHPDVDVIYGKQYVISHEGVIDHAVSAQTNETFYRTPAYAGSKLSGLEAAMVQQFPNDSYAVKTELAKRIGYKGKTNHACDFEFALALGLAHAKVFFLDSYTASYRLSADALSKQNDNNGSFIIYQLVEPLQVPASSRQYQQKVLREKAPVALAQAARLKHRREAIRILFGEWHRSKLLTSAGIKGVYHVLKSFMG
jgi:glycosyltransferase involved in cell wall biosynthesis